MFKLTYDGGFLTAQRALRMGATKDDIKDGVMHTAFQVERTVKIEMPKATGRAAGSWGHPTSTEVRTGDSVWIESDGGMTIEEGTNVEYVEALNDGWSRQASAGFIDAIARRAQGWLEDFVLERIRI